MLHLGSSFVLGFNEPIHLSATKVHPKLSVRSGIINTDLLLPFKFIMLMYLPYLLRFLAQTVQVKSSLIFPLLTEFPLDKEASFSLWSIHILVFLVK